MATPEAQETLQQGIAALKAGEREKARDLLMEVVEYDEDNEQGWLWLSGAVDTDADKRICLENVLTLNPESQAAKKGLSKLGNPATPSRQTIRREIKPHNLAGAILYPERLTQEWEWNDPTPNRQLVINPEIAQESSYEDIWEQAEEICAYCAQVLAENETKCPRCGQVLLAKTYRYPRPDTNLHILWIMLLGVSQLYMLQAIYNILVTRSMITAILPIFMMGLFLVLTAGVYFRRYWAFISAIILLIIILVVNIIGMFVPAELSQAAMVRISPLIDSVVNPAINMVGSALRSFQLIAIAVSLIVAVFKAAPDFERVETRRVAKLDKGLKTASGYNGTAQRAAKRGEWATAVLHWQRAAAKAPANRQFQRQLGIAYARIGFYKRSADVLTSALRITPDPGEQAQLTRLLTTVKKHLDTDNG